MKEQFLELLKQVKREGINELFKGECASHIHKITFW